MRLELDIAETEHVHWIVQSFPHHHNLAPSDKHRLSLADFYGESRRGGFSEGEFDFRRIIAEYLKRIPYGIQYLFLTGSEINLSEVRESGEISFDIFLNLPFHPLYPVGDFGFVSFGLGRYGTLLFRRTVLRAEILRPGGKRHTRHKKNQKKNRKPESHKKARNI